MYLQHVFATIDVFSKYTNTLGFFAANEVINAANSTRAATVVKALIRDMRKYIGKHVNRPIPVGYSAADVAENRREMAYFLNCGSDDTRSDFFAVSVSALNIEKTPKTVCSSTTILGADPLALSSLDGIRR